MKFLTESLLLFSLIYLTSCNNKDNSKTESSLRDSIRIENARLLKNTISENPTNNQNIKTKANISIWNFNCDSIIKSRNVKEDTLTYKKLIEIINSVYNDKIFLDFVKINFDTIFVKIKDSEYLTEQMGSCGADDFMISATFTLTELKNIKYVDFDFEYGDHASPGTYSRKYYLDWIENNRKINNK